MLLENFRTEGKSTFVRTASCKRALAVIACAALLAGCDSVPTWSEMGDGISNTYSKVETSVRDTYNDTFNSSDKPSAKTQKSSGATVALSRSEVKVLQRRLAKLNYDPGPADGVMGGQTVKAIRRYQAANNLPVTGKVSAQFLAHVEDAAAVGNADHTLTNSPYN